jgi:hypothetical protein
MLRRWMRLYPFELPIDMGIARLPFTFHFTDY